MNCKPGDLARVVYPGVNHNKLVFVLRRLSPEEVLSYGFRWKGGVSWLVESAGSPLIGNKTRSLFNQRPFADNSLRPIRDSDGEDETLTWAGKPVKETA